MKKYGIAVDIGTTTITAGVVDVSAGKELVSLVDFNPQAKFGQDVISRIDYCIKNKAGLGKLHNAVTGCVKNMSQRLIKKAGAKESDIKGAVFVGNTAMEHFFLKIPPGKLADAPYVSDLPRGIIEAPGGVYFLPVIKSFVGSDLTAGILYARLLQKSGPSLLVDIGTNGEMALFSNKKLFVTSTAAGPAFEVSDKGLLGSDIINVAASMFADGIIDKTGKLKSAKSKITQNDVRRIQVAKAAITAGMKALMSKAGLDFKDLKNLYVSGKFGNLINKDAAIKIGLLPGINKNKIKFIGNSAYKGAVLALCSKSAMKKSESIADEAIHLSLFAGKDFQDEFIKNMRF